MLTIEPAGAVLGATKRGLDAAQPIPDRVFGQILTALGQYGVLRFPDQTMDEDAMRRFSERFGSGKSCYATRDERSASVPRRMT